MNEFIFSFKIFPKMRQQEEEAYYISYKYDHMEQYTINNYTINNYTIKQ